MEKKTPGEQGPEIGENYLVKRLDGQWHVAEILETRLNESSKQKRTEYFVHFENRKKQRRIF